MSTNRRSFITSSLAALCALPFLSKATASSTPKTVPTVDLMMGEYARLGHVEGSDAAKAYLQKAIESKAFPVEISIDMHGNKRANIQGSHYSTYVCID